MDFFSSLYLYLYFFRHINDVDKTMEEINEQYENMKQVQEALSTPTGTSAEIDEVCLQFNNDGLHS